MKKLTLIRHAKSSWKTPSLTDHARPLNRRGKKNAPFMGKILKKNKVRFTCILSSTAKRALTTAKLIAKEINFDAKNIVEDDKIYTFDGEVLLNYITNLDDNYTNIAIVGHNPAITEATNYFANNSFENIPTCGIVHFECATNHWHEINMKNTLITSFEYPKKYE